MTGTGQLKSAIEHYRRRTGTAAPDPRAALIDMDGTLYDSMPHHAEAWHIMMAEAGIDVPAEEFFLHEGRTGADTINLIMRRAFNRDATPEEIERLYHRKTQLFAAMPPVSPMPGAAEMLRVFEKRGMERVLVTGSAQSTLISRLDTDYPGAFAANRRITARDVSHGKPAPEPFLAAMRLAGVTPQQSIVVENAPLGVTAGAASGAFTIAVNTGPVPPEALLDAGADILFTSMTECAAALPQLLELCHSN